MKSLRRYIFENLIIFESQESKSIDAAKKLVMDKFGWDRSKADSFVRNDLRQDLSSLRDVKTAKFILGVTRMFCDGELKDAGTINDLNTILPYISKDSVIDKWDRNLNGKSAREIIAEFKSKVDSDNEARRKEVEGETLDGDSDYEIVPIDSFEEASRYSQYTSWCITRDSGMFDSYTKSGINRFYFCLKKGYKSIKKKAGHNCPLDEYGLSMLAVCVKPNGSLATCTCRWNHDNSGNDNILNEKEISKVIDRNFYRVFTPNSEYENFYEYDSFEKICEEPKLYRVKRDSKRAISDDAGKLLSDKWFDRVYKFSEGLARVELNGKWNFIGTSGKFFSDRWFDYVYSFNEGFAPVQLYDKWNFIGTSGKFLSDRWFDYVYSFNEGFAVVELNDKRNFIGTSGKLLFDRWFDNIFDFNEGFAAVELNGKLNFIDTSGKLLSDRWFDQVKKFSEGFAPVELETDKWNFIDTSGKLLSDRWFDSVLSFDKGLCGVQIGDGWYSIRPDGAVCINGKWRKLKAGEEI